MPVHYSEDSSGPMTRLSYERFSDGLYPDYSSWTKPELQDELESRGLPKTGNKPELIARLDEDDR